jgi:uncharacterized protein (DUF2147 family)
MTSFGIRSGMRRGLSGLTAAIVVAGAGYMVAPAAGADLSTPVGEWRTIDDNTNTPKAIVKIFERNGKLYGVVEKSLIEHPAHEKCDDCTDDRRGKPILGMDIIRGMAADGDQWDGGTILDPENGKVYRCKMTLRNGGQELAVRGFIGISLLGRTQVWQRVS